MTMKKFFPPRKNKHRVGNKVWYYTKDYREVEMAIIVKVGKKFCICREIHKKKKFRRAFYNLFYRLEQKGQKLIRLDK
jgi:hypothetical protein